MSDYSFLKSGGSNLIEPTKISNKEREDIEIMLGLFTSNAIINASKYAEMCKRNAVTKKDMLYGLQYEVFEFLQRPDLEEGLREIRDEYEQMNEEYDSQDDEDEDVGSGGGGSSGGGGGGDGDNQEVIYDTDTDPLDLRNTKLNDLIVPDDETTDFSRIPEELITDENKEFVEKMHNYNDTWGSWTPQTDLEIILKSAIDKIN